MPLKYYVLSTEADSDLEDIYDYTEEVFGSSQAVNYLQALEDLFSRIVTSPEIGKDRNEIKTGLYSFPIESHVVFYRVMTDHIRIVRVLHGSRDIPKIFKN